MNYYLEQRNGWKGGIDKSTFRTLFKLFYLFIKMVEKRTHLLSENYMPDVFIFVQMTIVIRPYRQSFIEPKQERKISCDT